MTTIDATHAPAAAAAPAAAKVPWRRSLVRTLLYGRNVDRAAKTKARLGLAILVFALGYGVIAGRLIMFGAVPEGHMGRRTLAQDAVATARPDILDRHGEILATDVRAPSLFAEPNRIIDVDEATELLSGVLPDLDAVELRERLASKHHFAWLKRDITPSSGPRSIGSACRASASSRRTSASTRMGPRSPTSSGTSISTTRA